MERQPAGVARMLVTRECEVGTLGMTVVVAFQGRVV
jgi:hypothetical protein